MAEKLLAGDHEGQLVGGACRETVFCVHGPEKGKKIKQGSVIMGVGVAEIKSQGVIAVFFSDRLQSPLCLIKGILPRHLFPASPGAHHRLAQTVGIVVQILKGCAFCANVPLGQRIVFIPPDAENLRAASNDFQPAHGLANGTGTIMAFGFHTTP